MAALTVRGTVRVPGDKSVSHRSLMLSALAEGESRITGILRSADVLSTAEVLRRLGASIPPLSDDFAVEGVGLRGLRAPSGDLDCGNSGTTTRLMSGIVAGYPFRSRFVGDASLSRRPMRRVARPLGAMGARFEFEGGDGLPMSVTGGPLRPVDWTSEAASAQIKSAILLAALVGGVPATVREPAPSRDHSERMLRGRGVTVRSEGAITSIEPAERLRSVDVAVPGDPSSAAFFVALATLADDGALEIPGALLNPTRSGFLGAMRRMGASIEVVDRSDVGGEETATLRVRPARLEATRVEEAEVPSMVDELPLLACVAARAEGTTEIRGASELRVKESDRITAVVTNLREIGVEAEELPDGMRVTGSDRPLRGTVRAHADHRLAMGFGILGALPGSEIRIDDPACVSVSYPGFWDDLARVTAR